ncbi:MAG: hypothetical protein ACWA5Q_06455 [bacterium]
MAYLQNIPLQALQWAASGTTHLTSSPDIVTWGEESCPKSVHFRAPKASISISVHPIRTNLRKKQLARILQICRKHIMDREVLTMSRTNYYRNVLFTVLFGGFLMRLALAWVFNQAV